MNQKKSLLQNDGFQTFAASLLCIILGLIVGFLALLIINAEGASNAILGVIKNFLNKPDAAKRLQYFGQTLAKTAPLLLCSLSVLFAYKVGLFNIGAAGQYCISVALTLYLAIVLKMPWWLCLLAGVAAGCISGALCGILRAYLNVNVVISGIMINWISLYGTNMLLAAAKEPSGKDTVRLVSKAKQALLPTLGLDKLFGDKYVTIAIPIAIIVAVVVWIVLDKTKLGYELKATGNNANAAKYCGMKENRNIIMTMVIAGGLAALGGSLYYLSDYTQWNVNSSSVPAMGFNGIAAAFLGGLNPLGAIFSSYFITHITDGGAYVDLSHYCAQISDFISAVIIYLCGFVLFFKTLLNNRRRKADERFALGERDKVKAVEEKKEGGNKK